MAESRNVLIAGASSDIGLVLLERMASKGWNVGAHCFNGCARLENARSGLPESRGDYKVFQSDLSSQPECHRLVDDFVGWAGRIDALVQLTGNVTNPCHWETLGEVDWQADMAINLSAPFFLAQRACAYMKKTGGGRVVLMSTASAAHGGGQDTLAYGVAKAGVECLVKGLAKGGAPHNILVNALAPGLIATRFHHDRLGRDAEALQRRAAMVPLKRAGAPADVAGMIEFLLSSGGDFITGEVIAISGGDWL